MTQLAHHLTRAPSLAAISTLVACSGSPAPDPRTPKSSVAQPMPDTDVTPAATALTPQLIQHLQALTAHNPNLVEAARSVAESHSVEAKRLGSQQLVKAAKPIAQNEWRETQRNDVAVDLRRRGRIATAFDIELAVIDLQTQRLQPLFSAMEVLGGDTSIEFCLAEAQNRSAPVERRRLAVLVLTKHVPASDARAAQIASLREEIERIASSTGDHADTAQLVANLVPHFKRCFDKALASSPGLSVKGTMEIQVGPDGSVKTAKLRNAPVEMSACAEAAATKTRFAPPKSGSQSLQFPLNFSP